MTHLVVLYSPLILGYSRISFQEVMTARPMWSQWQVSRPCCPLFEHVRQPVSTNVHSPILPIRLCINIWTSSYKFTKGILPHWTVRILYNFLSKDWLLLRAKMTSLDQLTWLKWQMAHLLAYWLILPTDPMTSQARDCLHAQSGYWNSPAISAKGFLYEDSRNLINTPFSMAMEEETWLS